MHVYFDKSSIQRAEAQKHQTQKSKFQPWANEN
jgi:hypothetical protein